MGEGGGQQYCLKWNNYQVQTVTGVFCQQSDLVSEYFSTSRSFFQESLSSTFSDLLASDTFVDVTLSCEGQKVLIFSKVCMSLLFVTLQTINFQIVRAHRLLLSACSPYFRRLLSGLTSSQHPIIILRWSSCQENADASALFQRRKSFRLGGNFGVHLQWGSEHRTRLLAGLPCSC